LPMAEYIPTAKQGVVVAHETPLRLLVAGSGLVRAAQPVPFHCSMSGCGAS